MFRPNLLDAFYKVIRIAFGIVEVGDISIGEDADIRTQLAYFDHLSNGHLGHVPIRVSEHEVLDPNFFGLLNDNEALFCTGVAGIQDHVVGRDNFEDLVEIRDRFIVIV